eukprot:361875-Chlamydomonas_euryale.AAC.2
MARDADKLLVDIARLHRKVGSHARVLGQLLLVRGRRRVLGRKLVEHRRLIRLPQRLLPAPRLGIARDARDCALDALVERQHHLDDGRVCGDIPVKCEHDRLVVFVGPALLGRLDARAIHPSHKRLAGLDHRAHQPAEHLVDLIDRRLDDNVDRLQAERDLKQRRLGGAGRTRLTRPRVDHCLQRAHRALHHLVERVEDGALPVRVVLLHLGALARVGAGHDLLNLAKQRANRAVLLHEPFHHLVPLLLQRLVELLQVGHLGAVGRLAHDARVGDRKHNALDDAAVLLHLLHDLLEHVEAGQQRRLELIELAHEQVVLHWRQLTGDVIEAGEHRV